MVVFFIGGFGWKAEPVGSLDTSYLWGIRWRSNSAMLVFAYSLSTFPAGAKRRWNQPPPIRLRLHWGATRHHKQTARLGRFFVVVLADHGDCKYGAFMVKYDGKTRDGICWW